MGPAEPSDRRATAAWLFFCCALVFVMVIVGGRTPATGCHENSGSNVSGSARTSVRFVAVCDGHSPTKEAIRDCAPRTSVID